MDVPLYLIEILHQTTTLILAKKIYDMLYLIEILHQTTTLPVASLPAVWLYLIEILHQTTTVIRLSTGTPELYLIEILHQTTTLARCAKDNPGCILSKFYIKPQHGDMTIPAGSVVSYRNSTSNHNVNPTVAAFDELYLIEILHQTTTFPRDKQSTRCCILSKFYIKPQHFLECHHAVGVVSYRNSTSNHNRPKDFSNR